MDKTYHSRTNISRDVLLLMAKVSILTKQLNGLTLADQPKKQEIINELFGSVGANPFVGDNFHCDFGKISIPDDELYRVRDILAQTAADKGSVTKENIVQALAERDMKMDDHRLSYLST